MPELAGSSRLPWRRRPVVDLSGWTAPEVALGRRRVGHAVAARVNAMSGELPVEAILLARAITDTAPPIGHDPSPALSDVLDRYLPESLDAFSASARRGAPAPAQELLLTQLRLLHDVAHHIARAEAEHDERDLKVQAQFLRERFGERPENLLDLPRRGPSGGSADPANPADPAGTSPRRVVGPAPVSARPAHEFGRAFLRPDVDPVVLFAAADPSWRFTVRLPLPRGASAWLGSVAEAPSGATTFTHRRSRRGLTSRRSTGFGTGQVEVTQRLVMEPLRRFLVYAVTRRGPEQHASTLFLTGQRNQRAELGTLVSRLPGAEVTVIASGHVHPDGLVLRNESMLFPDLRTACQAFGYSRVTWLDAQTPFV